MIQRLRHDQSGAIIVMGLVMAVFLVSILYYSVGIGDAILFRERMQDGADSAAFSAAAMHARGMNLLVLINMVMAALLAILVALKIISLVCLIAYFIFQAICFVPFGQWACPLAGLSKTGQQLADNAYDALKEPILRALEGLHCAEIGLRYSVPAISQLRVVFEVGKHYRPPIKVGVVWPIYAELPVTDDSFGTLCGKAAGYALGLVLAPLGPLGDVVKAPAEALASTFPSFFCGAGGVETDKLEDKLEDKLKPDPGPPSYTTDIQRPLPALKTPSYQKCFESDSSQVDTDSVKAACAQVEKEIERSFPKEPDGACDDALCEQRVREARSSCKPGNGKKLSRYSWTERTVTAYYVKDQAGRVQEAIEDREYSQTTMIGKAADDGGGSNLSKHPPCKNQYHPVPPQWTSWNMNTNEALCHEIIELPPPPSMATGEKIPVTYREIQHITGCAEKDEITVTADEKLGELAPKDNDVETEDGQSMSCFGDKEFARSPQKVIDEAIMGEDDFQLRSIMFADAPPTKADRLVKLASWGKPNNNVGSEIFRILQQSARIGLAQSEFYYDADHDRGEWMWHMKWRARLRRFRLSSGSSEREMTSDSPEASCMMGSDDPSSPPNDCSGVQSGGLGLEALDELIIH